MSGDVDEFFVGSPVRIISVDAGSQRVSGIMRDGQVARIDLREETSVEVGDTLLVNTQGWESADADVWQDQPFLAVVRQVLEHQLLIETRSSHEVVENVGGLPVSVGNTILFSRYSGVTQLISEAPFNFHDYRVIEEENLDKFRVPKGTGQPTFADFGGYQSVVARARELIETQLNKKQYLDAIGAKPIKGILFTGPPGTGKTLLAQIIASESESEFFVVSGPAIISKYLGDSEGLLRRIFEAAESEEKAIIFFDEIDSMAEQRDDDSHEASKRLVAQLLTLMDGFDNRGKGNVVVIAATNRLHDLDVALRRPGRFDWEIEFGLPDLEDRRQILRTSTTRLQCAEEMPIEEIAVLSPGWSAARLASIWTEAALLAAQDSRFSISREDAAEAFERVAKRPLLLRPEDRRGH